MLLQGPKDQVVHG